jgi:hypothetical protein
MVSARAKRPVDRNRGSAARRLFIFGLSLYALRNAFDQPTNNQEHRSTVALHDRDPFARRDLLAVRWDDDVAICASRGRDVSRSLPSDQLDVGMFEFAGQDRGKKTLEPGFNADFLF